MVINVCNYQNNAWLCTTFVHFFMYRVFKHWKTEKRTYDRKSFIHSTLCISYLSLGLIIFFTGLFDSPFGRSIFDFFWLSAIILGVLFCIREFNRSPFHSLIFLLLSYIYLLFVPYIIMFSFM